MIAIRQQSAESERGKPLCSQGIRVVYLRCLLIRSAQLSLTHDGELTYPPHLAYIVLLQKLRDYAHAKRAAQKILKISGAPDDEMMIETMMDATKIIAPLQYRAEAAKRGKLFRA